MGEHLVKVVREWPGGGRSPVTEFTVGPNFSVKVERDKDSGENTVVIKSSGPEADDAVMLRTQETVRGAPSTDKKMAQTQLEHEGGVHVGVDSDGKAPDPAKVAKEEEKAAKAAGN